MSRESSVRGINQTDWKRRVFRFLRKEFMERIFLWYRAEHSKGWERCTGMLSDHIMCVVNEFEVTDVTVSHLLFLGLSLFHFTLAMNNEPYPSFPPFPRRYSSHLSSTARCSMK